MSLLVVPTISGKVKGRVINLNPQQNDKPVYLYRNIPFAKPPVGNLRFMPPQPADQWNGVKDCTIVGNVPLCLDEFDDPKNYLPLPESDNSPHVKDEDCLHLSVYTPCPEKTKKLPVMVWIYGGGFLTGSERLYDGTVLAGMNDVVVVVPNYRLGVLGFFSFGPSSICSGNQGILDQQLALKWVQDNIEEFGGDKNNVTIFGESAGGVAVNLHMISPLSRGLFHKAISHSGQATLLGFFHSQETRNHYNTKLLERLKIIEKDDSKIIKALQNCDAQDLLNAGRDIMDIGIPFMPTVDGNVFTKSPKQCLKDKDFMKVPYIIGCNSTECYGIMFGDSYEKFSQGFTEEEARNGIKYFELTDDGFEKCKEFYLKNDDNDEKKFSKMIGDLVSDGMFVAPAVSTADVHQEAGAQVYFYHGNFTLKMFHEAAYGKDVNKKVEWCVCDHGDDLFITHGCPFTPYKAPCGAKFTKSEADLSRIFMTYLSNFAKTGDPNAGRTVDTHWPTYGTEENYLSLETPICTGKDLRPDAVEFWCNCMQDHLPREK